MDSFRCVLASRLLLDHQLHGVRLSGNAPPAPEIRKIVEDATLIAFDHIIEACLVQDADCLLVSGESFHLRDHSLRGPAALIRGIQRLTERDIAVILHADRSDLWSNWPAGLRFPPNAHRLGDGFESRVTISRQGKLLATISVADGRPSAGLEWQLLIPEAGGSDRTVLLAADRPATQGIRPEETGSHGGSLVVIDPGKEPLETFLPAAPVRWERFEITATRSMSRDDLLQEMAALLEQTARKSHEKVWLVGWDITGEGDVLDSLAESRFRAELAADLAGLEPVPEIRLHTHTLRVHVSAGAARPMADDELAAAYLARLEERFARPEAASTKCVACAAPGEVPRKVRLETVLAELDAGEVARDARKAAMDWFA
jgi:hypothetical protein